MKHLLKALTKQLPANAPMRPLMEAVIEAEEAGERQAEQRQQEQRERHDTLRHAASERRRRILDRP